MNEKTTCDILIRNTSILDENFQIRRNIFIAIQNGIILSITTGEPFDLTATETIDGKDLLWMPVLWMAICIPDSSFSKVRFWMNCL